MCSITVTEEHNLLVASPVLVAHGRPGGGVE